MTEIEERFLQLNADIEELRSATELSKMKLDDFNQFFLQLEGIDLYDSHKETFYNLAKTNATLYLHYIRDQIQIIRKFSGNTADHLEALANSFEKTCDEFVHIPEDLDAVIVIQKKVKEEQETLLEFAKRQQEDLRKKIRKPPDYYLAEDQRNQYKKNFENYQKIDKQSSQKTERIKSEFFSTSTLLHNSVELACKSILDTLDFIAGKKN